MANGGKDFNTQDEIDFANSITPKRDGPAQGRPLIDTAIDASEVILALAPETNGHVASKRGRRWGSPGANMHPSGAAQRGRKTAFAIFRPQPRKIISSPPGPVWKADHVSYNAGYTNVHELIPRWRTLSGRQQLYQDHPWMRAFW